MPAYSPIVLSVIDGSTNDPIDDAQVFINGSANFDPTQFTVVTDSTGKATFQVPLNPVQVQMQVKAVGYESANQLLLANTVVSQSVQVTMTPSAPAKINIDLWFIPAVPGISWALSGPASSSGVTDNAGTSTTLTPIPLGTYTLVANLSGYEPYNQSLVVTTQVDPYTITLVQLSDPNSGQQTGNATDSSQSTSQLSSIVSSTSTVPPAPAEYTYPNSEYDKYFTVTGARMYIGNIFIDELNSVQYALQDNAVPIYGYASRYVDAYAQGRSLVQGQLTINFVTEGYLYTVMQEYQRFIQNTQNTQALVNSSAQQTIITILGKMAARDSLLQQANNNPNDKGSATQAANLQIQINSLRAGLTPEQMQTLATNITQQNTSYANVIGFDNAVYQDVLFDIRIELGNEITGVKRVRYLEKCKLISNEQVMAQDGQTLLDSYGFIARRLR